MKISYQLNNPWDNNQSGKPEKIEDILKKSQEKFMNMLNQRSKGGGENNSYNSGPLPVRMLAGIVGVALLMWLFTGLYTVQPDEEGVVLRFGRYTRTTTSGLNYKLPDPIETVTKVSVTRINREEIGFRSRSSSANRLHDNTDTASQNVPKESQMLTGDENIIDIDFDVQWKINDAQKFLFNVRDLPGENTVKTAAESAMREAIGHSKITDALAEERYQIEQKAKGLLQEILDSYNMGVDVVRLQMLRVEPPPEVLDAYRDVQSARADREREINRAQAYRNDVVPRAGGEAAEILQEAEGYKNQIVAQANGEAARFISVYDQYKNGKDAVRKRMYLETMEQVMRNMNKMIIDNKSGTMPILGIQELFGKKSTLAAPTIIPSGEANNSNSDKKD